MSKFGDRLRHAWNAFANKDDEEQSMRSFSFGSGLGIGQYRSRLGYSNDRSISSSIYARMGIDVAAIDMRHVRLDDNERYTETIDSGLNNILTLESNIDQGSRAFKQDLVMTMFEKGVVAIVPVDTSLSPKVTAGYDINTVRVGTVTQWYPRHVRVNVYNDRNGRHEEITLPKDTVAIVENPFYAVMNEPNQQLQRLLRKLSLLDTVDEAAGSGKLDLIIQLPYVIKTEQRKQQADSRARDIEMQLKGSKYGIAYTDSTEKITQLNRPVENNMLKQIEYLTAQVYNQLGLTAAVFDGTAGEAEMLNYHNRTIEPILAAMTQAMKRTFLTKTARSQKQSIEYFRDPFKTAPVSTIADIADKLSRNEILSSNEIRGVLGFKPSTDPKAEKLINSNMPAPQEVAPPI